MFTANSQLLPLLNPDLSLERTPICVIDSLRWHLWDLVTSGDTLQWEYCQKIGLPYDVLALQDQIYSDVLDLLGRHM